jgi:hypothetical protein
VGPLFKVEYEPLIPFESIFVVTPQSVVSPKEELAVTVEFLAKIDKEVTHECMATEKSVTKEPITYYVVILQFSS